MFLPYEKSSCSILTQKLFFLVLYESIQNINFNGEGKISHQEPLNALIYFS